MDQDFHLIEKYFSGELNKEELQLFNKKLKQDSRFEREFRDIKLIREGAKESARNKTLNILHDVEASLAKKETTKINVSMRRLVSIAASLIVIATVSYFAISDRTGGTMTGDEVFAAYYEPYTNLRGGVRSGDDIQVNTLSARAYNAYDIEDFSTSANLFAELLDVEKSAENFFYSGIANLEAGNLDIAKAHFNTVMNNYSELREQSQWYLAMTLLKSDADVEAIGNLATLKVSGSNSTFGKNAEKALIKMGVVVDSDSGEVGGVGQRPEEGDVPDGSTLGVRKVQFGYVISLSSRIEREFFNDYPIEGLRDGDMVDFVVIKSRRGKKEMAVLLGLR